MALKANFKKAAKTYKRLYSRMRGYFIDVRNEFEKCQRDRNDYMTAYRNAVDEIDRLKLKVEELTSENIKLQAEYNELVELKLSINAHLGGNNDQRKAD